MEILFSQFCNDLRAGMHHCFHRTSACCCRITERTTQRGAQGALRNSIHSNQSQVSSLLRKGRGDTRQAR